MANKKNRKIRIAGTLAAALLCLISFQNADSLDPSPRTRLLYSRLTGRAPTDVQVSQLQADLSAGRTSEAVRRLLADPDFLNIVVKNYFCSPMSIRAETPDTPLNEFTATCMGMVRDEAPATDMLLGNYTYRIDPALVPAALNIKVPDARDPANAVSLRRSNSHYAPVDRFVDLVDVGATLYKEAPQRINVRTTGNPAPPMTETIPLPDPAGLITTTTFMQEECIAGTNRRCVEFVFRNFLCQGPLDFADNGLSSGGGDDSWVGRDIDRFPANDHKTYETSCKGCHNILDGFRGAFAYYDWDNDGIKYDPAKPGNKYSRNSNVYNRGYITLDDSWQNNAIYGRNAEYFQWPSTTRGKGLREFAKIVSESPAFPRCMVKRAIRAVCLRETDQIDEEILVGPEAARFVKDGYNLKNLMGRVALNPNCISTAGQ